MGFLLTALTFFNCSSVARIQFRLPDGRSQMDRFNPDDPLEVLYRFVEDTVRPGFSRFALSTTYPRRQLDREDRGKTLRDLGLVPTSTILIMPASSGAAGAGTGGGGGERGKQEVTDGGSITTVPCHPTLSSFSTSSHWARFLLFSPGSLHLAMGNPLCLPLPSQPECWCSSSS